MDSQKPSYNLYLSKTLYMKGLQCHKALWLQKYRPELKEGVSESQQAIFDSGTDVGVLAQQLFPSGVEVPYGGLSPAEQVAMTKDLIVGGSTTIYEAAFSFNNIFVKVDILHFGDNGWELYEVKSSTGLKDQYLDDIAIQYHVLTGCGINLYKAALVYINNKYVRQGDIDVSKLFTIMDLTEDIRALQSVVGVNLTVLREMLNADMPVIDIGPHCSTPYDCSFGQQCWGHLPENSVFTFADRGKPNAFDLYKQGIIKIEDVPRDTLGWRQKLQVDGLLHQKNHFDVGAVREFLDALWYPLCFMDFETIYMTPVPFFDGLRPYQQVPFQFSLHIISEQGADPVHYEFLAEGPANPQQEFLDSILAQLPNNGCILTWNQTFEENRLKELIEPFPERSTEVLGVVENLRDLMVPFRDKSVYHWQFNGSYSLKAVLPALVPELSYDMFEVCNGAMASDAWMRILHSENEQEKDSLRQQLLEYCHLDTLAMVRIVEKLRSFAGDMTIAF